MRRRNLKSKANASRELAIGIIKERMIFGAEYILLENRYLIKGDISQLGFRLPSNSDI